MAAKKKQQTHAKRARELAVKEKRERKAAKKADRAAGLLPPVDENGSDGFGAECEEQVAADEATADPAAADEWIR